MTETALEKAEALVQKKKNKSFARLKAERMMASSEQIEESEEQQIAKMLGPMVDITQYALTAQQKMAAILAGRGLRTKDIAQQVGVQPGTINLWNRYPHFRALAQAVQNKMANEPAVAIVPMLPKAVRVYEEIFEDTDKKRMKLRFDAAQDILDRQYGKSVTRAVTQNISDVHIHFHDDPASDSSKYIVQDSED